MKSLIEFPDEVATPSSPSPEKPCKAYFDAVGLNHSDSDQSTSSTASSTESDSVDSGSDIDENDVVVDSGDEENTSKRRSVSFGPIHVRQYERIVGDHPETKVGVPLAIGWAYYEDDRHPDGISIDRYESDKIQRSRLRLSSITRKNMMLHVFKLDEEEIRLAEKRSMKLRIQNAKKTEQSPLKKFGKKMKKGGMNILKGMSQAAQFGSASGLMAAVDHAF